MKINTFFGALLSALMLLVLASFVMGMQLSLDGTPAGGARRRPGALVLDWRRLWGGIPVPTVAPVFSSTACRKSAARPGCCPVSTVPRRARNGWRWR